MLQYNVLNDVCDSKADRFLITSIERHTFCKTGLYGPKIVNYHQLKSLITRSVNHWKVLPSSVFVRNKKNLIKKNREDNFTMFRDNLFAHNNSSTFCN